MTKKRTSLKDIAEVLNTSVSTVSRALKDHPDISPALKKQIQNMAFERNYKQKQPSAKREKSSAKTIGIIVPDMVTYFFSAVISGIENYAKEKGYFVVITNSHDGADQEEKCVNHLLEIGACGVISSIAQETKNFSHFSRLTTQNIPLVFFDRIAETDQISSVGIDNTNIAQELTCHFHENGAKRIACLAGPKNLSISRERTAGYLSALIDCNQPVNYAYMANTMLDADSAEKATNKLLQLPEPPDALLCINDTVAFGAMRAIRNAGLSIPHDIALSGFTNEMHATVVEPPLTSVAQPTEEMGQEAAKMLIEQIENGIYKVPRQIVMKSKIVVRKSSVKTQL
ncbi:LacI family DNA-binding transcriptional regulator [Marinilabilia sp.]|uniref:LacI family DNA-binding transcriptional regulator n=1 Tax=Marinilabilia sp. TaxID=2021252 RepID=UPI0025C3283B|nr:LacI family DNA-binding transcriptional regulator [Marinilabilia sp.]